MPGDCHGFMPPEGFKDIFTRDAEERAKEAAQGALQRMMRVLQEAREEQEDRERRTLVIEIVVPKDVANNIDLGVIEQVVAEEAALKARHAVRLKFGPEDVQR